MSSLERAIEKACEQAEDPKFKSQIRKLQRGRKKLLKKFKEDYAKMVEEALKE